MRVTTTPPGQLAPRFEHVIPDHDGGGIVGPDRRIPHFERIEHVEAEAPMVLAGGMVARKVDAERFLDREDLRVARIAHVVQALMVVRLGREDVAMAALGRPFCGVEQDYRLGFEFGVAPGVVRYVTGDVIVVIGDREIVEPRILGEFYDLRFGIVGGILAVTRVQVEIALEPLAIGQAGNRRNARGIAGSGQQRRLRYDKRQQGETNTHGRILSKSESGAQREGVTPRTRLRSGRSATRDSSVGRASYRYRPAARPGCCRSSPRAGCR
ncbi:hypothetical protein D9M73_95920 [compost metagenome]